MKNLKIGIIITYLLNLLIIPIFAQTSCPQTLGDNTWHINEYVISEALPYVPLASANYDWREIGGRRKKRIYNCCHFKTKIRNMQLDGKQRSSIL